MKEFLYSLVEMIAEVHAYVLKLNDNYEFYFNDKELHFIVIGLLGMAMVICIYPIFKRLAKKEHYLTLTWIYVFTLIIVITFAIEIGQKATNTGSMEFADIMFGVAGFIVMYLLYACVVMIFKLIGKLIQMAKDKKKSNTNTDETKIVNLNNMNDLNK